MKTSVIAAIAVAGMASVATTQARADAVVLTFNAPGISGNIVVSYGPATDATYPNGYQVTGITGTFSDLNTMTPIIDATVTGLVPINHAAPEPTNLLAPHDFSHYPVAVGTMHGFQSYDNLYWPAGSPPTATDWAFGGGVLDIYGLLFTLDTGDTVNLWSDGLGWGGPPPGFQYGVAVINPAMVEDSVFTGVQMTVPEPASLALLGVGLLGLGVLRRRTAR